MEEGKDRMERGKNHRAERGIGQIFLFFISFHFFYERYFFFFNRLSGGRGYFVKKL